MSSFANRVQLEIKNKSLSEVSELVLDNAEGKEIDGLSADLTSLESLSLSNVGLESLKGLPNLPSLKSLNLSSNSISDFSPLVTKCPNLEKLILTKNPITSTDILKPLTELSSLTHLDIKDVEISAEDVKTLMGEKVTINAGTSKSVNGGGDCAAKNGDSADHEAEDDDEEEDDEPGLEELEKDDLEDDAEDYNPEAEEEEEDDDDDDDDVDEEDDEEADSPTRGTKRKADSEETEETEAKKVHTENGSN